MIERIAASIVALAMLAASGVTGGVAYLCVLDGQVRSACCCKPSAQPEENGCDRIERADNCCEARDNSVISLPARFDSAKSLIAPRFLVATLPARPWAEPPETRDVALSADARAPPRPGNASLFIWNCSYLI